MNICYFYKYNDFYKRRTIMKKGLILSIILGLLMSAGACFADEQSQGMTAEEFEASLNYQKGEIKLPGEMATIKVTDEFRYLGPEDAERILVQAWGNPNGAGTLGMLFPNDISPLSENGWGIVITYEDDGYVSDKDADSIDYAGLLKSMKAGIAEENKERQKEGYQTIELIGWAAPPRYDKTTHKLYWAKELDFHGSEPTLNYNIRVLGRRGVLVLNAVAGMSQLQGVEQDMRKVLAFTDFNQGYRYEDYDASTDKTAAYGLAALVAGGVAAKAGLFTKLFGLLVAFKKAVIAGVIALGAVISKIFKRKKTDRTLTGQQP
jgi:uncharacterized membrane-anchored protein